jgi:hypothetical protein
MAAIDSEKRRRSRVTEDSSHHDHRGDRADACDAAELARANDTDLTTTGDIGAGHESAADRHRDRRDGSTGLDDESNGRDERAAGAGHADGKTRVDAAGDGAEHANESAASDAAESADGAARASLV